MPIFDFTHLTPKERLDLIGELWDSIEADTIPLTAAQEAELDRRLETLDEDIKYGMDAADSAAELERRYK